MNPGLDALYQEIVLDHAQHPRNFGELSGRALRVRAENPSCGDEIHLALRAGAEGVIADLRFTGKGCALCLASASLMTVKLKGKGASKASDIARTFTEFITADGPASPELGDLLALGGVRQLPQRVKCVMLAWRAFESALG